MSAQGVRLLALLSALGAWATISGHCLAAPALDAINDVGGPSAAFFIMRNNFRAQSFTTNTSGLLSQVDLQIGKYEGASQDVTLEVLSMVNGAPAIDDRGVLYSTVISIDDIPDIGSLFDPPPFMSVDLSDAGIRVKPGDEFAISLLASGSTPASAWRGNPDTYSDGKGYSRPYLDYPWIDSGYDFGFQTWVDPEPSAPYKLRIDPTYDVAYQPGDVMSLIEGKGTHKVGGIYGSGSFPEERPIMEFPIDDLPRGAVIQGVHLELDFNASSGAPRIEIIGFAGDGIASFPDATVAGTLLATTPPTSASSSGEIPIDASFIDTLRGQASHLGIRMRSLDLPEYVSFYALEYEFPQLLPPRLVIDYVLPDTPGDFDADDIVDATDLAVWRTHFGKDGAADADRDGDSDLADLMMWQRHFASTSAETGVAVVPEPSTIILAMVMILLKATRRNLCL